MPLRSDRLDTSAARPRRRRAARLVVALLLAAAARGIAPVRGEAGAETGWGGDQERRLNDGRRAAVRKGCAWIAGKQSEDGSFGDNKALVAFTALSSLALMANGSGVARGPYGVQVKKAVEFLVRLVEQPSQQDVPYPDGYFHAPQDLSSKMHGQGYATLALASALGSADEKEDLAARIRAVLRRAVRCAEASQTGTGGWGYLPDASQEHEGSVTVTIAQGLRAARDAGILVSHDVVVRGLNYLRASQKTHPPGSREEASDGSFKYSISTERSTYALTAAAVSSFFLFGEYGSRTEDRERIRRGIAFLKRTLPLQMSRREWHFYGSFYAAWAAWQKDGDRPEPTPGESWGPDPQSDDIQRTDQFWGPWHSKVYPDLLAQQRADGSWEDRNDTFAFGDLLPTVFAVLTLAIPDEMVPVFQR